jgi:FtsP/CotA-like multicopper oxidase with cupredoxin domain
LIAARVLALIALIALGARAEEMPSDHAHHGHAMEGMRMSATGMVMNENTDRLPRDCRQISRDVEITVHAGRKYAPAHPGTMFAYDQPVWAAPGCARVTVTLVNDDQVRHQWMVHGLPRYLYPEGMFHLEVSGAAKESGTFIVPSAAKTYLVHCDVPQHAEKGMKAELKVAGGDGDLPSIPGISAPLQPDRYRMRWDLATLSLGAAAGLAGALVSARLLRRR